MKTKLCQLHQALTLKRFIFFIIFLLLFVFTNLFDADYFWHLKTGEYIYLHHRLPDGDIFSYTALGKNWVLHEWLFELTLYVLYSLGGDFFIKLFVAFIGTTIFLLLYKISSVYIKKSYLALFTSISLWPIIGMGFSPRPQIFSYLFFALYVYLVARLKKESNVLMLYLIPIIMLLWVNIHGGFIIGLVFLLLLFATENISFILKLRSEYFQKLTYAKLKFVIILTFAASLCNPYFIKQWLFPFYLTSLKTGQSYISEWQSPNFHIPGFFLYLCLVFLVITLVLLRRKKPSLFDVSIAYSFVVASFISARHIPLAAIALLPLASTSISDLSQKKSFFYKKTKTWMQFYDHYHQNSKDLGHHEFTINWIFLFLLILALFAYYPIKKTSDIEAMNKKLPIKATDFVISHQINGRLFNAYDYGGYLISRFYPDRLVFIDGRLDMYGDQFMEDYIAITEGKPNWESLFDQFNIDCVMIQRELPLRQLLLQRGDFKIAFEDQKTVVLVKKTYEIQRD